MRYGLLFFALTLLAACGAPPPVERVTVAAPLTATAPDYTATPTRTPSPFPTATATPSATVTPSSTPSDTATVTSMPSDTPSATFTPTQGIVTPALPDRSGAPPAVLISSAPYSAADGWSCGTFPCEDDIDGFLAKIRVPLGFHLEHVGRFNGQVMQLAYGRDGRLYATVHEDGTLTGSVHVLNDDGTSSPYSPALYSPLGLAFAPASDTLYITARNSPLQGAALLRFTPDGVLDVVRDDLPCCLMEIDNQANGLTFGSDGYLYMGVGALTDHTESATPLVRAFVELLEKEASVLRVDPLTGASSVYASRIRNPFDVTFDSAGRAYATDSGTLSGYGDRVLALQEGGSYGFPYYRARGCEECPPGRASGTTLPDLVSFPAYTLPRGLTAYTGASFPRNLHDTLFVALWNTGEVVWIDPKDPALTNASPDAPYQPQPFVTGLIKPIDVVVAPDGSLVVADWLYGHVWRVVFSGDVPTATPSGFTAPTPSGFALPTLAALPSATRAPVGFATITPPPTP